MRTIDINWPRVSIRYVLSKFTAHPEAGCWNWKGSLNNYGYGRYGYIRRDGKASWLGAHRIVYELFFGPLPEGWLVCHHCDNPKCVRPSHLFLGTHTDNIRDASRKGRTCLGPKNVFYGAKRSGEHSHTAKLTTPQVQEIRRLAAQGKTPTHLAAQFGVTDSNIVCIVKRKSWRNV